MTTLIIVVSITVLVSANCSLYEAVLFSTRVGALEVAARARGTSRLASRLIRMKSRITQPIAAILILNTIANTAGATIAGMVVARELGTRWIPAFSIGFTLTILFLSEILPKTLGAVYWRKLWPYIVFPVSGLRWGLYPLVMVTQKFTDLFTRGHIAKTVTQEEIEALIHVGTEEGSISQDKSRLVRNIIDLEEETLHDIMTPRTVMFSLHKDAKLPEVLPRARKKGLSRIPVFDKDPDDIVGYVMLREMDVLESPAATLEALKRPIAYFPHTADCLSVLINFLKHRRHIAVVTDEYGGVDGLVTLEDLMETMLGSEIVDETDTIVDLQKKARQKAKRAAVERDSTGGGTSGGAGKP